MKKILYAIFLCLLFTLCKAQNECFININSQDLIAFSFSEKKISTLEPPWGEEIYNQDGLILLKRNWLNYGYEYFHKEYTFIRNLDTMKFFCNCGQLRNMYFKNLKFKKGEYTLNLLGEPHLVKAKDLFHDEKLTKLKVTDSYNRYSQNLDEVFIDLPFSELDFILINTKQRGIIERIL